jgi:hypothetical protein
MEVFAPWLLEQRGLLNTINLGLKSKYVVSDRTDNRHEFLVLFYLPLLCHHDHGTVEGQSFQFLAALSKFEQPDGERDVILVECMQEIQNEDRLSLGGKVCQRIEQPVTGGCPGASHPVESLFDFEGISADESCQFISRKPFTSCYDE